MSSYDQHPGGGYEEVKGYENPAGSMAEEAARMRDDEMRRQQQADADRQQADIQAQQHADAQAARSQQQGGPAQNKRKNPQAKPRPSSRKSKPAPPGQRTAKPAPNINTNAALLAFLGVGAWTAFGFGLEGAQRWFAGLLAGGAAAYVAGRYIKQIIVTAVVIGGFWLYINLTAESGNPAETTTAPTADFAPAPAPAIPAPSAAPNPTPSRPDNPTTLANAEFPDFRVPPASLQPAPAPPDNSSPALHLDIPDLHHSGVYLTDAPTDFHAPRIQNQAAELIIIHDAPLDFEAVDYIGFSELYDRPVVRLKSGQRIALNHPPLDLPPDVRDAFKTLNRVTLIAGPPQDPVTGETLTLGQRPRAVYDLIYSTVVNITLPDSP